MLPITWRYLLKNYLKISFITFFSFVSILLITRLDEVADYATLSPQSWKIILFGFFQIIYIIPIALPISCLVGSIILFQSLSHSGELTSLRAAGLSLRKILFPILLFSGVFSLGSFYVSSELATQSNLLSKAMQHDFVSLSPLSILKNPHLLKLNQVYTDMEEENEFSESVKDFFFGMYNPSHKRLNLITASNLHLEGQELVANNVSIISSLNSFLDNDYDHLVIETQKKASSPSQDFSFLVKKKGWSLHHDYLRLGLLRIRIEELKKDSLTANKESFKEQQTLLQQCYSELSRRFSISLAPFTFTLMGAAFGAEISRRPSKRGIFLAVSLASIFLILFFTAKSIDHLFPLATATYFFPHLLIMTCSAAMLSRISKGIE
jgi:lipopolysaccharide export system permease protein